MTDTTAKAPIIGTVDYGETLGWVGTAVRLNTEDTGADILLKTISEIVDGQVVTAAQFGEWGIDESYPDATHLVLTYESQAEFLKELISNTFAADGTVIHPEVQPGLEA